jgi:hypothetical protein
LHCATSTGNLYASNSYGFKGTPTKRQISKRQVSKRPVSKRLKRQVYKTSGLQNVRFTKRQVYKMSGLQNIRSSKRPVAKKHPYIFCTCDWWKPAGSVAAMFAGKVMAVFYFLFLRFFCHISPYWLVISKNDKYKYFLFNKDIKFKNWTF